MSSEPRYADTIFKIITEERIAKDILLDRYGNYVFQKALLVAQGTYRTILRDVRLLISHRLHLDLCINSRRRISVALSTPSWIRCWMLRNLGRSHQGSLTSWNLINGNWRTITLCLTQTCAKIRSMCTRAIVETQRLLLLRKVTMRPTSIIGDASLWLYKYKFSRA